MMGDDRRVGRRIVVAIPCYNEELTVAKVVADFRRELPEADVVVLDNRSTDRTAERAREAGAEVVYVARPGKGSVVRHIFREIDADVYLMVDGDDTYPAEDARALVDLVLRGADMAVGDRLTKGDYGRENKRPFHGFGNSLVRSLVNFCFGSRVSDVMSGLRAFSRRFAKNVPILSDGFEVETEMTIRCLDRKLALVESPISYRDRPEGSFSKLSTYRDGARVLKLIFKILKDYRPLLFFGSLAAAAMIAGLACGAPVLIEYARSSFITRVPLAILATGFVMVSITLMNCAFVLYNVALALSWGISCPLALASFWLSRARWRELLPIVTIVAYFTLIHVVVIASLRYRLPIEPLFIMLGADCFTRAISRLRRA